jgi:AAA+ superfamily predicted ATPase
MSKSPSPLSISPAMFDATWFSKACGQWEAGVSNVIVVETDDPDRDQQMVFCVQRIYERLGTANDVHLFDPWTGLMRWDLTVGKFVPASIRAGGAGAYDSGLTNELRELSGALNYMGTLLQRQPTALILRNVEQVNDHNLTVEIAQAIRNWAANPQVTARKSMVCVVASSGAAVMDTITLAKTIMARPELATTKERHDLIAIFKEHHRWRLNSNELQSLAANARGLGISQLRRMLQSCGMSGKPLDHAGLKASKGEVLSRSETLDIEEPSYGFESVGGYQAVKDLVIGTLIRGMRDPERAKRAAISPPRGLLLFGPPGTGKTLFAKAMARETGLPFINLRTENIFAQHLGESGQRLQNAIRLIEEASPALVFIDEIDRFGKRGGGGSDGASQETQRVFGQMLEWLGDQNRRSVIVGATNEPDHLDDAFIRHGRFSFLVPFLYPDKQARLTILGIHLGLEGPKPKPVMNESEVREILEEVANRTKFCSGAEIEAIVDGAKRRFFLSDDGALDKSHLLDSLADFRVDESHRQKQVQRYLDIAGKFGTSAELLRKIGEFD